VGGVDLSALGRAPTPVWWLDSATSGGLLLSEVSALKGGVALDYGDCALFEPEDCPAGARVENAAACRPRDLRPLAGYRPGRLQRARGALTYHRGITADVYLGNTIVLVFGRGTRGYLSRLRRFGRTTPPARYPRAGFRRAVWRDLDSAAAAVRETGSARAAAGRLALTPRQVRDRVAVRRKLVRFGARRLAC
jgi:hypothetical protein